MPLVLLFDLIFYYHCLSNIQSSKVLLYIIYYFPWTLVLLTIFCTYFNPYLLVAFQYLIHLIGFTVKLGLPSSGLTMGWVQRKGRETIN